MCIHFVMMRWKNGREDRFGGGVPLFMLMVGITNRCVNPAQIVGHSDGPIIEEKIAGRTTTRNIQQASTIPQNG
jgi:hypothetical protein